MSLRSLLGRLFALLLPLSAAATIYLYLYPVFNGCAFPLPSSQSGAEATTTLEKLEQSPLANTFLQHLRTSDPANTQPAIFRLLVLADPQLEGDTSLPFPEYELIPRIRAHWATVQESLNASSTPGPLSLLNSNTLSSIGAGLWCLATEDIPRSLRATQKRVDLLGNDYYLAHIYRTLFWWTRPTHTTVLGDLLGSQWIPDDEFTDRSHRYWERVFRGGLRIDDNITWTGAIANHTADQVKSDSHLEPLGPGSNPEWARRIINVAGNHDIGYAGDVSEARTARFEQEFGRANWDIRFQHPPIPRGENDVEDVNFSSESVITPTLHVINLNTLVFDTPALSSEVQSQSYTYLNDLISERSYPVEDKSTFTLLLTHLPLHKEAGICTDGPYFTFHEEDDEEGLDGVPRFLNGGLREQNHLSDYVSDTGILSGIFGMSGQENAPVGGHGRKGLILTGHDHTGCDTVHYVERVIANTENESEDEAVEPAQNWKWVARRYQKQYETESASETPSIREVTLRSMMGEFGGNAGLLSVWFDTDMGEWDYEITLCPAGVQHIWWAVHVTILVTFIVGLLWFLAGFIGAKQSVKEDTVPIRLNGTGEKPSKSQREDEAAAGKRRVEHRKI
ncbi:uncharacterized protein N7483_000602 [Penicillium malachiteum]|uniref:uncharacterized protein n=1 Tax=Penicillium malachiteum TaxID=1324776 RepID=UPI00254839E6|nr:uncharacterized protein N7483_000602 [Penicillium malachiteum]KAJ5735477.1 hypothetical protein N7483_000602 [Penicillium malachiteum]